MTDAIKYIDVDDEQFEDAPKALRDAYKALARQHKEQATELGQVRTTLASKALGDVLGDKGFANPKRVEKALLADDVDPLDSSAVEAWLTENGNDFAKATASTEDPNPVQNQTQTPEQEAAQAALAAQYAALQGGDQLNTAGDMSKWDLAQSEITPDMTGAQVAEVYKKHGI